MILCLCFIAFYYVIQAALSIVNQDETSPSAYFEDNVEGLYSLYVAMTTANHPGRLQTVQQTFLTFELGSL